MKCKLGWFGLMCDCIGYCGNDMCSFEKICLICKNGWYGRDCRFFCLENCNFIGCQRDMGFCLDCKIGYYGSRCLCIGLCGFGGCDENG